MIQCFDGGKYDRRFDEVYKPGIERAKLRPIRADLVLGTRPIIETIEGQISKADAILADISENNENVFLELGYALALNKASVIICDKEKRTQLPFDVRHRPVIFYDTHTPSSFNKLSDQISQNLSAEINRDRQIIQANVPSITNGETVEDYENVIIGIILSHLHDSHEGISAYMINRDFEKFGYVESTMSVALGSLTNKKFILKVELYDQRSEEKYTGYQLTDNGMSYVIQNRHIFAAKKTE